MAAPVDVRVLAHQAAAFRLLMEPGRKTVTLVWGRGLGKSYFIRLICWLLVAKYYGKKRKTLDGEITGIRIHILMPTLKQFKAVHGALFEAENNGKWKFLNGKIDHTDWTIRFPDGSFIMPVPAALATSERGRGFRSDVNIFDEGDDVDVSIRNAITSPWLTEPWALGLELIAGTPKRGRHGLMFDGFRAGQSSDPQEADSHSFRVKSADCPLVVLPAVVEAARRKLSKAVFAREYEADFDSAEGLVYPFDEDLHVREPASNVFFSRYAIGGDHGWTDPGCLLLGGITGHGADSTLWILQEEYASERPNHIWDGIVRDKYKGLRGWLDPSRPDRINDYRRAGLNAHAADNSIEAGVARVIELLAKRETEEDAPPFCRLYVSPRCVNTIREFKSYRRKKDPKVPDSYLEDIEDKNNHAMDALRYMVVGEFGMPSGGNYRHETPGR